MRMTAISSAIVTRAAGAALGAVRPAEKASDSAPFGERRGAAAGESPRAPRRLQVELVCQHETKSHDPFWDAPRLNPAFVAQLLGQALEQEPGSLPARGYAAAAFSARLFDASV
jgi:hypothetical protein